MNLKDLVGQQVVLFPTGNNARPTVKLRHAEIVSVARLTAVIQLTNMTRQIKVRISDYCYGGNIHIADGANEGYVVFKTEEDYDNYVMQKAIISSIGVQMIKLNRSHQLTYPPLADLTKAAELLGIDPQDFYTLS